MARTPKAPDETKIKDTSQGDRDQPAVKDAPPASPLGEPVYPVDKIPNQQEPVKVAVLGEDAGPNAVPGETIVEHPLSPTDSNPNPHGQRDEGIVSVATKDADGNVQTSKPEDGDTEIGALRRAGSPRTVAPSPRARRPK
ncbi:hypothetical protein AB5I41_30840 [Sphingomonas sp. MMS24-JH45]